MVQPAQRGLVGLVGLVGEVTREPGKYFSFFLAFPKKPGCTRRLVEPAQRGLVGLVGLVGEVTREPGKCFFLFLPTDMINMTDMTDMM